VRVAELARPRTVVAHPDGALRVVGLLPLSHMLRARTRHLEEEHRLEGALPLPFRQHAPS